MRLRCLAPTEGWDARPLARVYSSKFNANRLCVVLVFSLSSQSVAGALLSAPVSDAERSTTARQTQRHSLCTIAVIYTVNSEHLHKIHSDTRHSPIGSQPSPPFPSSTLPPLSFPSSPFSLPLEVGPLNTAKGSGGAL